MDEPFSAIGLRLQGRRVVFAGGGEAAERRLSRLLDSGASLEVFAPEPTPDMETLATRGRIALHRRLPQPEDFAGARLAFIAIDDPATAAELAAAARRHGALVNRADDPDDCDFVLPALAWMNTVHIGVFSDSPVLSKWVRRHLERTLGPEFPEFAATFTQIRERVRATGLPPSARSEILTRLLNEGLYQLYRTSGLKQTLARVDDAVRECMDRPEGHG